jgi:ATP-dependent RNA helicase RhlE
MPFRAFNLGDHLNRAVEEAGYTEPTPIQVEAIPKITAGHDLIGIAQTGTGKTAAFVLPILSQLFKSGGSSSHARGIRWLILAPTRELVVQIEENAQIYAKYLPARIATVIGGVSERPQIKALRSGADLVIATPGRLLDLVGQGHGDFSTLRFLVLDEADRMLDMGFIPQIRRIIKILPSKRQTLLFSATLSKEIEALAQEFLQRPKMVQIGRRSNPAETVTQLVYEVPAGLKPALLIHLLRDPSFDSVLVFTRTKHGADRIAKRLGGAQITTATLHSNRSQNQRLNALKAFKSGEVRVLVATDIAARGIDVDGISHVVNFDFPMHPEDYVHRIGRTGRAQAIGDAISFVTPEDRDALRSLERFIGRGVVRKRADDFDYHAVPAASQERRENRPPTERKSPPPGNRNAQTPGGDPRANRRYGGRRFKGRS